MSYRFICFSLFAYSSLSVNY